MLLEPITREELEQGLEQGRDLEKKENAKKLKAAGTSVDVISDCLGLSVEEINSL